MNFHLEERQGHMITVWTNGGCEPAKAETVELWNQRNELLEALEMLDQFWLEPKSLKAGEANEMRAKINAVLAKAKGATP